MINRLELGQRVVRMFSLDRSLGYRRGEIVACLTVPVGMTSKVDIYAVRWDDDRETISHGYLRCGLEREPLLFPNVHPEEQTA